MDDTLDTEQSAFSPTKNVQSGIRFDGISHIFFFSFPFSELSFLPLHAVFPHQKTILSMITLNLQAVIFKISTI